MIDSCAQYLDERSSLDNSFHRNCEQKVIANKMTRLFFGFLLIFLVHKETSSYVIFGIRFEQIMTIYEYMNTFYTQVGKLRESSALASVADSVILHDIMRDLKRMSKQLSQMQDHQDIKLDTIMRVLLDNMDTSHSLEAMKSDLIKYVHHIDYIYRKGTEYVSNRGVRNETLKNFVASVLEGQNNLEETAANLYFLIVPGATSLLRPSFQSLSLSFVKANYERLCDKYISERQWFHYISMIIISTHLKAFATITQAYALRFKLGGGQYPYEYGLLKTMFHEQLTRYFQEFTKIIHDFPREIRRCDISRPQMRVNILEFEGLFQVVVNTEVELRKKLAVNPPTGNYADGNCEDIKSSRREQSVIYNCKTTDSIRGCPVGDSRRGARFSWWQTASDTFGHPYQCPGSLHTISKSFRGWGFDNVCTCSLNFTDGPLRIYRDDEKHIQFAIPRIMWISVEPQMSDVRNNMIVVGVRFIVHENSIHLQIQQNKLIQGSVLTVGTWKPVDVDNNNKKIPIHYDNLFDRRNIMHLDDVGVDPRYVVTGVRLQLNRKRDGYELNVHGTELIDDGYQLGASQMWYKPGEYPTNEFDYIRNRSEIHLEDPDDPSSISLYHPDPEANKFIQFQHSSIAKDGGFHTVPLIDAQPVTVSTPSPLSGIGLFHRHREGYGGYIAPRLFTHDYTKTLEISLNKWEDFDAMYQKCKNESDIALLHPNCSLFRPNTRVETSTIGPAVINIRSSSRYNHCSSP